MAYTAINKHTDYFNTVLYTGNGSARTITTGLTSTDFIWNKRRDNTGNHMVYDVIRGVNKDINTDSNEAEETQTGTVTAFGSNSYTLGTHGGTNANGETRVSWNWAAGGTGSSNTDGSINTTSTSVNTTAGFSISKYTGNNTAGATVGHGLGVAPEVVIFKRLDTTGSWISKFNSNTDGYMYLHANDAMSSSSGWLPTSSTTFTLANQWTAYNASGGTYIAYCFAPKTGFSKFGEYTGNNNADGTFVYTGFKPAFVLVKPTNYADNWHIIDNKRDTYNTMDSHLFANLNIAENTSSSYNTDFLSNGFKPRNTNSAINGSYNYIYMAFAEAPLVGSNNIPCTAR
mgnify:CR=1 FL=1